MIFHNLFNSIGSRLIVSCLFLAISCGLALAGDWEVRFKQKQSVVVRLNVSQPAYSDDTCPEHFRLARLSAETDLDRVGALTVKPKLQRNSRITTKVVRERTNPRARIKFDLSGCVFRQYFLPQNGQVTFSGDFGVGKIESTECVFEQNGGSNSFKLDYYPRFSGFDARFSNGLIEITEGPLERQVMGTLQIDLPWTMLPLIADERLGEEATLSYIGLIVFVISEDETD